MIENYHESNNKWHRIAWEKKHHKQIDELLISIILDELLLLLLLCVHLCVRHSYEKFPVNCDIFKRNCELKMR